MNMFTSFLWFCKFLMLFLIITKKLYCSKELLTMWKTDFSNKQRRRDVTVLAGSVTAAQAQGRARGLQHAAETPSPVPGDCSAQTQHLLI